jgi:hypothetical protein
MPLPGRPQKPPGQAVNRVPKVHDWIEIPKVRYSGAPRMPAKNAKGEPWHPWAKRWYKAISTMPHCVLWDNEDWEFFLATLNVVDKFHQGDTGSATELRNREKIMGVTYDSRLGLRIRYIDPPTEQPADVSSLDDYRAL